MSTYPAGTVAAVTYKGQRVRAARLGSGWQILQVVDGYSSWTSVHDVTDITPLVVLDLGDYDNRAVTYLRNIANDDRAIGGGPTSRAKLVHLIADQIEAQTKPPRIPEPGLWGVVEASTRFKPERAAYVRTDLDGSVEWMNASGRNRTLWTELIDPTLVREGLS